MYVHCYYCRWPTTETRQEMTWVQRIHTLVLSAAAHTHPSSSHCPRRCPHGCLRGSRDRRRGSICHKTFLPTQPTPHTQRTNRQDRPGLVEGQLGGHHLLADHPFVCLLVALPQTKEEGGGGELVLLGEETSNRQRVDNGRNEHGCGWGCEGEREEMSVRVVAVQALVTLQGHKGGATLPHPTPAPHGMAPSPHQRMRTNAMLASR